MSGAGDEPDETTLLLDLGRVLAELGGGTFPLNARNLAGLTQEDQIALVAGKLEDNALLPKGDGIHYLRTLLRVYQAHTRAASAYSTVPQPLPAVTLLRALESPPGPAPEMEWPDDLGWQRYSCQTLDIIDLPGNHLTMMTPPHVAALARILQDKIAKLKAGEK
ncbi:MAG: hypothetical protein BWY57_01301 [Betaproteobacteria bacterium ADurb.Bin341]|nr:MAG: hypothetical protein BWY57_01301 [Betaproteobacteria bacterium ADurb.Bin341]